MDLGDEMDTADQDEQMVTPGTSVEDPRTYDPTQGAGTPGWQRAKEQQRQLNERLKNNAEFRRN